MISYITKKVKQTLILMVAFSELDAKEIKPLLNFLRSLERIAQRMGVRVEELMR